MIGRDIRKRINKDLSEFKLDLFISVIEKLKEGKDAYALKFIQNCIVDPKFISSRPGNFRSDRDLFFGELYSFLDQNYLAESIQFLVSKCQLISCVEEIFDEILSSLKESGASKLSPDVQAWAQIERAKKQINDIVVEAKVVAEKNISNQGGYIHTGDMFLVSPEGNKYSPDSACEQIIFSLSLSLSMFAYENGWYQNGKVFIPVKVDVSDDDVYKIGSTELLAFSWKKLEDIANKSLLFGGLVEKAERNAIPEEINLKSAYRFIREESDFEKYDRISNIRLWKKLSQNNLEILTETNIREKIVKDIQDIDSIDGGNFLSTDEGAALVVLCDIFSFDIKKHTKLYEGLTISEWVRGYAGLGLLPSIYGKEHDVIQLGYAELKSFLISIGLIENKAQCFIDLASFGKSSKDLYDCPIINVSDGHCLIMSSAVASSNIPLLILSRMSSLEIQVEAKGEGFERAVNKKLNQVGIKSKEFKFSEEGEEYEYDSIFILDKCIFVIECKNRVLSSFNPVRAFRKQAFFDDTVLQLKRLVRGLVNYPQRFKEAFDIELSDFEIVPVILNCLPFSYAGQYQGVYITDASSFFKVIINGEINVKFSVGYGSKKQIYKKRVHKLWKGDTLTHDDLISSFNLPIQIQEIFNYQVIKDRWFPVSDEVAFLVPQIEIDQEKELEDKKKYLVGMHKAISDKPKKRSKCKVSKRKKRRCSKKMTR